MYEYLKSKDYTKGYNLFPPDVSPLETKTFQLIGKKVISNRAKSRLEVAWRKGIPLGIKKKKIIRMNSDDVAILLVFSLCFLLFFNL